MVVRRYVDKKRELLRLLGKDPYDDEEIYELVGSDYEEDIPDAPVEESHENLERVRLEAEGLWERECLDRGKEARRLLRLKRARVYFEVAAEKGYAAAKISLGFLLAV